MGGWCLCVRHVRTDRHAPPLCRSHVDERRLSATLAKAPPQACATARVTTVACKLNKQLRGLQLRHLCPASCAEPPTHRFQAAALASPPSPRRHNLGGGAAAAEMYGHAQYSSSKRRLSCLVGRLPSALARHCRLLLSPREQTRV